MTMREMTRGARGWLFAAGVMAALGFGGAQAMAAPAADAQARACNPTGCNARCQAQGGISGRCTDAGLCACLF
jgi:hypothetical protein